MSDMPAQSPVTFSRRLKKLRESAGLTQQELGTRAGISISNLAQLEQGQRTDPRLSTVLAIARALGVRPSKLIDGLNEGE